jgi:nicotinamidase-related amidase
MARRALMVIDVQNEYVTGDLPIEYPDVTVSLRNMGWAMDAARECGIPVVVVQTTAPATAPIFAQGSAGWELHEVVRSRGWDHYIEKRLPSAFVGTGLAAWIAEHGFDTLAVTGYMTHNCDDTTIKHAFDAGLAVEFLSDASGSLAYENRAGRASAEEIHRVFSVVQQSRFAAVPTTEEWIQAVKTGAAPERDSIYGSNRRARQRRQVSRSTMEV